jgi:hypothetical protein
VSEGVPTGTLEELPQVQAAPVWEKLAAVGM